MSVIILLCRNTLGYTRGCLRTLLAQTVPAEILVINNASTDGTAAYLRSQSVLHGHIYVMNMRNVTGVARCWNLGLRWAWARGHSQALVVNNDTELLPCTYEVLAANLCRRGMLTAVGVDREPTYSGSIEERPHPDYSCYMISRAAHLKVPFDELYDGAYLEDSDHHVRLHRAGIWAGSIPLEFRHFSSGTLKHASAEEQRRIQKHYDANRERFRLTYGTVPGTKGYSKLFEGE